MTVPTPDIPLYYRRALILPIALSVAGFAVREMLPDALPGHGDGWLASVTDTLAWTGLCAAVPYAVFVLVVWVFFRPEGAVAHRRMAALAPTIIALSLALLFGVPNLFRSGWRDALGAAALFGGFAFAVGTVHSLIVIAVVEVAAVLVRRRESPQ